MGLIHDGVDGIKALRMAVHIPSTVEEAAEPLFMLEEGVASSSAGIVCATMAGVKQAVIVRASEVVEAMKQRRKVQPLVEILRGSLDLSSIAKSVLVEFVKTEWSAASESDIDQFLSKVSKM